MCQVDTVYMVMVLIAIWPVQRSENAVHLTGHKDSGTKKILQEKWRPTRTGFERSKLRDSGLETYFFSNLQNFASGFNLNSQIAMSNSQLVFPTFVQF